jgi:UDP-N-acetyl-D-glucosamine dehydrogenase
VTTSYVDSATSALSTEPTVQGRDLRVAADSAAILDPSVPDGRNTVAVVGLGYVGLPTALSLLESGSRVIGLDSSLTRLDDIRSQNIDLLPIDAVRLHHQVESDDFWLTADATRLGAADVVIICVPTPVTPQLVPDLRTLSSACAAVVANARAGQTIILTSTSYVGSTRDLLELPLLARGLVAGTDVYLAFSPERIDPGVPDHTPATTPRIVGGRTAACTAKARAALIDTCPSVHTVSSPEAAEMTKLWENVFRAVNIALVNEVADITGHLGLSVSEIIEAAATKPYGFMKFTPGPGVGGHCIPIDPHYLLWQLRGARVTAPVIDAAMTGISLRPRRVVARLREVLADSGQVLCGARVHIAGVAYKPGVRDVRESSALEIIDECLAAGAHITYSDAYVPVISIGTNELRALDAAPADTDIVLVHTRHPGDDLSWLADQSCVLDATYGLGDLPHDAVV